MNLQRDCNSIITQFKPANGQWRLNDESIKRISPNSGTTILHNYCSYINSTPLAVFKFLIETHSVDINARDKYNHLPIHYALQQFNPSYGGDITVLGYLLHQDNLHVEIGNQFGRTLLHTACEHINKLPLEVFKYLIEKRGIGVHIPSTRNDHLLFALQVFNLQHGGDIAVLTYLLNQDGVDPNAKVKDGCTLLHSACSNINGLHLDIFKVLIEIKGADVSAQNDHNDTPILTAVDTFNPNHGDINILTYLLTQNGINVNINGRLGRTLLHCACAAIHSFPIDVFKFLIETKGANINAQDEHNNTPIGLALGDFQQGHDCTILNYLLYQDGIDVNIKARYSRSLLHEACFKINCLPLDVFKRLVEIGADINATDRDKNTPVHIAFHRSGFDSNMPVLNYLLAHKDLAVNLKDQFGRSLLHFACLEINSLPIDIFKLLIETRNCDFNVLDDNGNTPIHVAFRRFDPKMGGDFAILTYLLHQKNLQVNIQDQFGRTVLHFACQYINALPLDIFKLLIETNGADVNARDVKNNTPYYNALSSIELHLADGVTNLNYLLSINAVNPNTKGLLGRTLLHLACAPCNPNRRISIWSPAPTDEYIDTFWCQSAETIIERCLQKIADETICD